MVFLLVIAAFGLGLFIGYQVRAELKLLPAPKVEPTIPLETTEPIPEATLSEIARKLAEEYK
jgi:hypothetical protein